MRKGKLLKGVLVSSLVVSGAFLTACGGGGTGGGDGGGGGEPTNQVTVKVWNYMGQGSQVFVAAQDGTGSFTKLTTSSTGNPQTYTFQVNDPSGKYGVIVVCAPSSGQVEGNVTLATLDDTREITVECGKAPEDNTLSGSLTWRDGTPLNEGATIIWGNSQIFTGDTSSSYTVQSSKPTNDLVVVHASIVNQQPTPDYILISRGVSAGTFNIDFNSSDFQQVDTTQIILDCQNTPPSGTSVRASLIFRTSGGTILPIGGGDTLPVTVQKLVPSSLTQQGDRFYYIFSATDQTQTSGSFVQISVSAASPSDPSCPSFPPIPSRANFVDDNNNGRVEISFNTMSTPQSFDGIALYAIFNYESSSWIWSFSFSSDYVGNSSTFSWEFPDLSSLSGWNSSWMPDANATSKGRFSYFAYTGTKADFRDCILFGNCPDGFKFGYAFVTN